MSGGILVILTILLVVLGVPLLVSTAARLTVGSQGEFRARVLETLASAIRRDVPVEPQFLWLIAHDERGRKKRAILEAARRLDEGLPLSAALSGALGLSATATASIASAEGTSNVGAALRSAAREDRDSLRFFHGVLMRLAYPTVILAFLGGFVGLSIAPKFQQVTSSMELHTPALMWAVELTRYVAGGLIAAFVVVACSRKPPIAALLAALHGLRREAPVHSTANWLRALSGAVRAGRPIDEAMERTAAAIGHRRHVTAVRAAAHSIHEGTAFAEAWERLPVPTWLRARSSMLAGPPAQVAAALDELSAMASERAEGSRERFLAVLSPALLLVCGSAVGLVFGELFMVLAQIRGTVSPW